MHGNILEEHKRKCLQFQCNSVIDRPKQLTGEKKYAKNLKWEHMCSFDKA